MKAHLPSKFPYFSSISQFWKVRKGVLQRIEGKYPPNSGYQMMIWVIGISFSVENFLKGLYENSMGRITELVSGRMETLISSPREEIFLQRVAQDYAHFIRDKPWYEFPFHEKTIELWNLEHAPSDSWLRGKERKFYGLIDLGFKVFYSWVIQKGTASTYEPEDFYLKAEVSGFTEKIPDLELLRIEPIQITDMNHQVILLPRYESFSQAVRPLVRKGVQFHKLAGNQLIAFTAIAPRDWKMNSTKGEVFLEWDILTSPVKKRMAIATPVENLHRILTELESQNVTLDHIYDY